MNANPICSICGSNNWEIVGTKTYSKSETSGLSNYAKVRYEVLFNVWLPGSTAEEFESILCNECGFVAFRPRPSAEELVEKYAYIANHADSREELTASLSGDEKRAEELYSYLKGHLQNVPANVLDYGGGNGRLMGAFLDAGHKCSIVDYIEDTLPNIQRLGANVSDIPKDISFDIIVCSHVLEHLPDPANVVKELAEHLTETGILYIEVPLEIWDGAPLPEEPVTHINFFTPESMKSLLSLCDLQVLISEEGMFTTEEGGRAFATRALAKKLSQAAERPHFQSHAAAAAKKLISPSISTRWRRLLKYPEYRRKTFKRWTVEHLPETFFWRFFN